MAEFRKIKVGVFGAGRGRVFMNHFNEPIGLELVAICDNNPAKVEVAKKGLKNPDIVTYYEDFDEFLKHPDMEAVVLTNYFNEHAPYAIKALKAGKHVLSECCACSTLKEGVELCEAVEETGKIYMIAENYPYTAFNQEMRRLYHTGEIGEVMYAEGEYNHPPAGAKRAYDLFDSPEHWRYWLPATYYCTHGIAPLMYITDTMPKSVNAQAVAVNSMVAEAEERFRTKDECAVSMVRMDNGSIFRLMGIGVAGHSIWYRVHGNRGAMEASRGKGYFGPGEVRVWHEPLHLTGEWAHLPTERTYYPSWPAFADKIGSAGHGGGDFWVNYHFAEAIRNNEQPYLDVYRACAMSSVGICGWLSVMNNGENVEIPDFKDKVAREKYRSYDKSPFPSQRKLNPEGWIKPSSVGPDDYDYYLKLATAKHNLPRT